MSVSRANRYRIREFSSEGLQLFSAWLERAEANSLKRFSTEPPPVHLLHDDRYAIVIEFDGQVDLRFYDRKFDMGFNVCQAVGPKNMMSLLSNANALAWLALFYSDSTMPFKNGKWFTGARSRHVVETISGRKQDQSHRHLVKGAATNVFRFAEFATVLMGKSSGMSKIEEQIMSRKVDPPLAFLYEIVKALHALYWDNALDQLRSGASGDGNGSIMQFQDVIGQLDFTYDISYLTSEKLLSLLPLSFAKFLKKAANQ